MELVFASQNQGKTNEIRKLIPAGFSLTDLKTLGIPEELDEPFFTLEENAVTKAEQSFRLTGLVSFADDTGLEIEALNGRPGVLSARYAGDEKDPQKNMAKVLEEMHGITNRKARFRTVIAFFDGKRKLLFEGIVNGSITNEKRGNGGFGYDPVFIPDNSSLTFAEMSIEEKNGFSHRAKAVGNFLTFLKNSY